MVLGRAVVEILARGLAAVEVGLAGQGADAPAVAMRGVQVHPDLLRLHGGPSWLSGL
jgi:hypothetical protein